MRTKPAWWEIIFEKMEARKCLPSICGTMTNLGYIVQGLEKIGYKNAVSK